MRTKSDQLFAGFRDRVRCSRAGSGISEACPGTPGLGPRVPAFGSLARVPGGPGWSLSSSPGLANTCTRTCKSMFYFRMLPAAGRRCGFACCSGQMFSETAAVSHGGRGGDDDDEHLFTTTPTAATPTPRDSAEVVLRELGIERLTRGEFERCFKRTFGSRSRVLGTGSFATVFLHRDCRLSVGPGEFVATKNSQAEC